MLRFLERLDVLREYACGFFVAVLVSGTFAAFRYKTYASSRLAERYALTEPLRKEPTPFRATPYAIFDRENPKIVLSLTKLIPAMAVLVITLTRGFILPSGISESWALFRGDTRLTGFTNNALPEEPQIVWTFEVEEGIESTAAILSGTVYVGTLGGRFVALELDTGRLKWEYKAEEMIRSSPLVVNGTVYFGDEMGTFHALDARTGQRKWTFQVDGAITSSANFLAERIIFGSYDQFLYCLSDRDGALLWKVETGGYIHATPAVFDERVLIGGCDGFFRVIDLVNGKEETKIDLAAYMGASPAVYEDFAYMGTFENQVLAVDLRKARTVWRYQHPQKHFPFYSSAAVSDELVVLGGRDKMLHALDRETGEAVWTFAAGARVDSSPVILGDRVVFASMRGEIYILKLSSGEILWKFDTGSPILASPSIAGGKLVIGTEDGLLYCFGETQPK